MPIVCCASNGAGRVRCSRTSELLKRTLTPARTRRIREHTESRDDLSIMSHTTCYDEGMIMARTPGATNLTVRELGMQVTIASLRKIIATLKQDNKALKDAVNAAHKASPKK